MRARFDAVDARFEIVDAGFMEMRAELDRTAAGQDRIVVLLTTLIEGQDDRS